MVFDILPKLNRLRIVLGSQSPRRRDILTQVGIRFTQQSSDFEETLSKEGVHPPDYVVWNALGKALDVFQTAAKKGPAPVVIGCDSVVVNGEQILEKPRSEAAAVEMLTSLSNSMHQVVSGVSLVVPAPEGGAAAAAAAAAGKEEPHLAPRNGHGQVRRSVTRLAAGARMPEPLQGGGRPAVWAGPACCILCFAEATTVEFAECTTAMAEAYVATGEPMDKAGSYGIQGRGALFVERVNGCYFNVMGLPIHRLAGEMRWLHQRELLPVTADQGNEAPATAGGAAAEGGGEAVPE